jgi:integrase
MNSSTPNGPPVANLAPIAPAFLSDQATLRDLLDLIQKPPGSKGPALHSAASTFLKFLGTTAEETPLHRLEVEREGFGIYLTGRPYSKETIKSYRYCISLLMKIAREHGWEAPPEVMPPDWALVLTMTSTKAIESIVRYAVRIAKKPSTFTEDDLRSWCQERVRAGCTLSTALTHSSKFRKILGMPAVAQLRPLVKAHPKGYGVPLSKMHPSLRSEVEKLLAYRTDEFELDRSGPPIRKATADGLCQFIVKLTGFVENIHRSAQVENLATLLTRDNVASYVSWCRKERKVQGEPLIGSLATLRASFKEHPHYVGLDLSWVSEIIKKLPHRQQSDVDRRKEKKLIPYAVADDIPRKIREARKTAKALNSRTQAINFRNELIMQWLIILPWRQMNLRNCRISGGPHRNLYSEPIRQHSTVTMPDWLVKQEKSNPGRPVWQIYFSTDETKGKQPVSGFLPQELVVKMEEYLAHRGALIPMGRPDPGTLFLTADGEAMDQSYLYNTVRELTSKYAGVATNPHLFRDIVAYEWLSKHPADYLTISKLLWHRNLEHTLKVYGSRFDESAGIARMDDWRSSR